MPVLEPPPQGPCFLSESGKGEGGPYQVSPRSPSSLRSPSPPPLSAPQKLLGKLCEQNKVVREQDRLVQQLRAEKVRPGTGRGCGRWPSRLSHERGPRSAQLLPVSWGLLRNAQRAPRFLQESLESALMGTHQELEMFGGQPAYPEKLLHKKEALQNQLISIRVELSQASTVTRPARPAASVRGSGEAGHRRLLHLPLGWCLPAHSTREVSLEQAHWGQLKSGLH